MTDPIPTLPTDPYWPDTAMRTDAGVGQLVTNGADVEIQTSAPLTTYPLIRRLYVNQGVVVGNPVGGDMGPGTLNVEGTVYSSTGPQLLDSRTIVNPVPHVDISLPAGYSKFHLSLWDATFQVPDAFSAAYSFDNGQSFAIDMNNNDTYRGVSIFQQTLYGENFVQDATMPIMYGMSSNGADAMQAIWAEVSIYPGSTGFYAYTQGRVSGSFVVVDPPGFSWQISTIYETMNTEATIPPGPPKRATTFRWFPGNNIDFTIAPTNFLVTGSWTVYGIPTPKTGT